MKDAKLGRLRRLDIRRFWEDQDSDFRSWLSQEENMGLLGETVGLELEPLARDPAAAATHSELLCRDTVSDRWIVVAADAEDTDDARLGQVLAQAAGLNAGTVIWVSSRFDDAQRATLDWLNEITDTRFHFFGLEVELWQIEDSPAAPRFNVVAKPNDWTKTLGTAELEWREQTGKRESAVVLQTGADPAEREGWEEQHGWLLERLEQFHRVFSPRVRTLDADEYAAP